MVCNDCEAKAQFGWRLCLFSSLSLSFDAYYLVLLRSLLRSIEFLVFVRCAWLIGAISSLLCLGVRIRVLMHHISAEMSLFLSKYHFRLSLQMLPWWTTSSNWLSSAWSQQPFLWWCRWVDDLLSCHHLGITFLWPLVRVWNCFLWRFYGSNLLLVQRVYHWLWWRPTLIQWRWFQ